MKKIIGSLVAAVMLVGSGVFAADARWKVVPYISLKGGVLVHGSSYKQECLESPSGASQIGDQYNGGANSVQPLGYVSFGCAWQDQGYVAVDFYMGGQVGDMKLHKIIEGGEINSTIKLKHPLEGGGTLRLGYTFGDAVLFLGLGLAYGKWSMHVNNPSGTATYGMEPNSATSFSDRDILFKPGLGVILKLSQCFDAIMEYSFFWGPSFTRDFTSTDTWKYSTKVRQHALQLGVIYRFKS